VDELKRSAAALSTTSSSTASAASGMPKTTMAQKNSETMKYLPQFIVRRFGDEYIPILTDSCQLKSKFKAKNGIIEHRYTVSWIEEGPIHQEIDKMSLKTDGSQCSKYPAVDFKSFLPHFKSFLPRLQSEHSIQTSSPSSREVLIEVGNNTKAAENIQPNVRKCDGPCAQMRYITDLRVLGRCEHAICSFCVVNAPMVQSDDGSMGCCNKKCFAGDLINQISDSKRRHELYSNFFENQKFEEIFKLYKGDIRREKFPRKDLNSQYSNTSIASSALSKSSPSNSSFSSSMASLTSVPSCLYEPMGSLGHTSECTLTKSSGKYDVPPGFSSSTSESESERKSVKSFKLQKPVAHEILMLCMVILEPSYYSTFKRHHFEEELESEMPLISAVELLMGNSAGRNLFNSTTRIFYCPNETLNTQSMLEMNVKEHGKLTMGQLATNRGKISIVIDYTGKLVQGKRQPFTKSKINGG
uniref:Uncharacterized protein n=1 Tax=Panagrolaimus sp. PS1159 TaxID=55785 RepID=A0AC35GEG6_9BILA